MVNNMVNNMANNIADNRNILYRQDKLLDIRNERLDDGLRKLEEIQSSIINKDRIIDQINDNITNNNSTLFFLTILVVFAFILLFIIISYGQKVFSIYFVRNIFIVFVVLTFLLYLYSFNIFHLHDGVNFLKYHRNELINNTLKKWDNNINSYIHDNKEEDAEWEYENCDCPAEEEEYIPNIDLYDPNKVPVKGYFYYDGNDPAQLLVPEPVINNANNINDTIDWVDYSEDGEQTYYDFPHNKYRNKLNNVHEFVDNKTYSANF
jgi:hypothetical protein